MESPKKSVFDPNSTPAPSLRVGPGGTTATYEPSDFEQRMFALRTAGPSAAVQTPTVGEAMKSRMDIEAKEPIAPGEPTPATFEQATGGMPSFLEATAHLFGQGVLGTVGSAVLDRDKFIDLAAEAAEEKRMMNYAQSYGGRNFFAGLFGGGLSDLPAYLLGEAVVGMGRAAKVGLEARKAVRSATHAALAGDVSTASVARGVDLARAAMADSAVKTGADVSREALRELAGGIAATEILEAAAARAQRGIIGEVAESAAVGATGGALAHVTTSAAQGKEIRLEDVLARSVVDGMANSVLFPLIRRLVKSDPSEFTKIQQRIIRNLAEDTKLDKAKIAEAVRVGGERIKAMEAEHALAKEGPTETMVAREAFAKGEAKQTDRALREAKAELKAEGKGKKPSKAAKESPEAAEEAKAVEAEAKTSEEMGAELTPRVAEEAAPVIEDNATRIARERMERRADLHERTSDELVRRDASRRAEQEARRGEVVRQKTETRENIRQAKIEANRLRAEERARTKEEKRIKRLADEQAAAERKGELRKAARLEAERNRLNEVHKQRQMAKQKSRENAAIQAKRTATEKQSAALKLDRSIENMKDLTKFIREWKATFLSTKHLKIVPHRSVKTAVESGRLPVGIAPGAKAVVHNGEIHLFTDRLNGVQDIFAVLNEEGLGHILSRTILGKDYHEYMLRKIIRDEGVEFKALEKEYGDLPEYRNADGSVNKMAIADEVFSRFIRAEAEKPIEQQAGWFTTLLRKVRDWFRKVSGKDMSMDEVREAARMVVATSRESHPMYSTKSAVQEVVPASMVRYSIGPLGDTESAIINLRADSADGFLAKSGALTKLFHKVPSWLTSGAMMKHQTLLRGLGNAGRGIAAALDAGMHDKQKLLHEFVTFMHREMIRSRINAALVTRLHEKVMTGGYGERTKIEMLELYMALNDKTSKWNVRDAIEKNGYKFMGDDTHVQFSPQDLAKFGSDTYLVNDLGPDAVKLRDILRKTLNYIRDVKLIEAQRRGIKLKPSEFSDDYWMKNVIGAERQGGWLAADIESAAQAAKGNLQQIPNILSLHSSNRVRRGTGVIGAQNIFGALMRHMYEGATDISMGQALNQYAAVLYHSRFQIEKNAGKAVYESLLQSLEAAMGGHKGADSLSKSARFFLGNFQRSALAANISTIAMQPLGLLQACNLLSKDGAAAARASLPKHLTETSNSSALHDSLMLSNPTYANRFLMTEFAPDVHEYSMPELAERAFIGSNKFSEVFKQRNFSEGVVRLIDKTLVPMQEADAATCRAIYEGVMVDVRKQFPQFAKAADNDPAFLDACNQRFTKVINESQTTVDPLTRTANQNSPNFLYRGVSMFTNQISKTTSSLIEHAADWRSETDPILKAAKKEILMRDLKLFMAQNMMASAIGTGAMLARNEVKKTLLSDAEKRKIAARSAKIGNKMAASFAGRFVGFIPVIGNLGSDLVQAWISGHGYPKAGPIASYISDAESALSKGVNMDAPDLVKLFNTGTGAFFGMPLELSRMLEAASTRWSFRK